MRGTRTRGSRLFAGIALVMATAMTAAACGGGGDAAESASGSDQAATSAAPSEEATSSEGGGAQDRGGLTWIAPTSGQAYYDTMGCAIKAAGEAAGFDVTLQSAPDFDPNTYNQLVEAAALSGPTALLIDPISGAEATPAMTQAVNDGIAVVSVETETNVPGQAGNVIVDSVEFGRLLAQTLIAQMGEEGEVYLMDYILGSPILDARAEGIKEELAKYPGIKLVGHDYGGADANKAAQLTLAALERNPNIVGIVSTDTYDVAGVVNAVKQKGLRDQIKIVDLDLTPAGIDRLKAGDVDSLVIIKPAPYGEAAVKVAVAYLDGTPEPDPYVITDSFLVVDQTNIDVLDDPNLQLTTC